MSRSPLPSSPGRPVGVLASVVEDCVVLTLQSEVLNVELSLEEEDEVAEAVLLALEARDEEVGMVDLALEDARVVVLFGYVLLGEGNDTGPRPPGGKIKVAVMTLCVGTTALGCPLHIW